jgi:hypothetical protein
MNAEFIADPFRFAHRPLLAASIVVTGLMAIGILLDASQDIGRLTVSLAILATAAIMMTCSFRLSGKLVHYRFFADGLPYIVFLLASLSVGVATGAIKFVFLTGLAGSLLLFILNGRDNLRDAVRTYFLIPR